LTFIFNSIVVKKIVQVVIAAIKVRYSNKILTLQTLRLCGKKNIKIIISHYLLARPRKILNFKNPKEIFFYNFAA